MKSDLQVAVIVLGAACVAINVSVGTAVYLLKAPLYLDSVGIMVAAILAPGSRAHAFLLASLVGVISFVIGGLLVNPFLPWFIGTAIVGAAYGAFVVRGRVTPIAQGQRWRPASVVKMIAMGIGWGIVAAIVSAPVVVYLFGGVTGSGTALLVAFFIHLKHQILSAAILAGLTAEPVDKTLQLLAATIVARATPANFRVHIEKPRL